MRLKAKKSAATARRTSSNCCWPNILMILLCRCVRCSGRPDVQRLCGSDIRPVHIESTGEVVALSLSQVLRLSRAPQWQMLLQGRRRLLQGRLLPVSTTVIAIPSTTFVIDWLIDYLFAQTCCKTVAHVMATEHEQDSQAPSALIAALIA